MYLYSFIESIAQRREQRYYVLMTKTMNHSNCPHPSTSSARAKCRKERAARVEADLAARADLRASYYSGDADAEEVIAGMRDLGLDIDPDADLEELISSI